MNEIRCVRCGREAARRGQLNPELHRVLYLCDDLCPACVDDLHEWWMLPPGARRRSEGYSFSRSDRMVPVPLAPLPARRPRYRPVQSIQPSI